MPVPLVPATIVSHGAALVADHEHPAVVLTLTAPLPPTAAILWLLDDNENSHPPGSGVGVGGPGVGGVGVTGGSTAPAAFCDTLNRTPAITTSAERSGPALGATSSVAVPAPVPVALPAIEIHGAELAAVHTHSAGPPILTVTRAPFALTAACVGVTVNRHAARCVTSSRRSFTTMAPVRWTASGLAATLYATCASPCPLAGETVIHGTSGLADHVHSRLMPTPTVPAPPLLASTGATPFSVSAHRAVVGAVTFVLDEEPHAAVAASAPISATQLDHFRASANISF